MATNKSVPTSVADNATGAQNSRGRTANDGENPYKQFFSESFGAVFGRPFGFSAETDPSQRVFQHTMLRNNTLVNIIPGNAKFNEKKVEEATKITTKADEDINELKDKLAANSIPSKDYETGVKAVQDNAISDLLSKGIDLEVASIEKDIAGFLLVFQQMVIQLGTATFGTSFAGTGLQELIDGVSRSESSRGFRLWCDKATTVTESSDNSYSTSSFEKILSEGSGISKEIQQSWGYATGGDTAKTVTTVQADSAMAKEIGMFAAAANILGGAKPIFPKYFDTANFNRSYDLAFKFVAPYGDNITVFYNVMIPFLFILALALPKQEGVNGYAAPFLMEIDCPGFFCSPMAAIQSLTFRKGGDGSLFNPSGLPLVIEGSISVVDMIGTLSIPVKRGQMAVNKYSRAYMNNLGGLSLYETLDPKISASVVTGLLNLARLPTYPIDWATEAVDTFKRRIGMAR